MRQKDFQNMTEFFVFSIYDCPLSDFSNLTMGVKTVFD